MVAQEAGKLDGRCYSNLEVRTAWTRHSSEVGEMIGKFISKAKYNILTGLGVETTTTPTKKKTGFTNDLFGSTQPEGWSWHPGKGERRHGKCSQESQVKS